MSIRRSQKSRSGDVGILKVDDGAWAKLQYLGAHDFLGDAVLIDPDLTDIRGKSLSQNLLKPYTAFYSPRWKADIR